MSTPWGMINARREAEKYRHEAWQAQDNEKRLLLALVRLIAASEHTVDELEEAKVGKRIREELRKAVDDAKKNIASDPKMTDI